MTTTMRVATLVALTASLAALPSAAPLVAAEPSASPAPADLRELAGQAVPAEPNLAWKYTELLIEWGFKKGAENLACDGAIECTQTGMAGKAKPLPGDSQTTMTAERSWKSPGAGQGRRGIVLPVLYTPAVRGPSRTILTVRTSSGSFSSSSFRNCSVSRLIRSCLLSSSSGILLSPSQSILTESSTHTLPNHYCSCSNPKKTCPALLWDAPRDSTGCIPRLRHLMQ